MANQALINVLSNPKTIIPDELTEYLFSNNKPKWTFRTLLVNFNKPIIVEFAIDEAKLVLSVFETMFPGDSRPRDAILAASALWLRDHGATADAATYAATYAAHAAADAARPPAAAWAAWAAAAATYAARAAAHASYAAAWAARAARPPAAACSASAAAADAADAARYANPSVTLEDQIERLFCLALNERNSINAIRV